MCPEIVKTLLHIHISSHFTYKQCVLGMWPFGTWFLVCSLFEQGPSDVRRVDPFWNYLQQQDGGSHGEMNNIFLLEDAYFLICCVMSEGVKLS